MLLYRVFPFVPGVRDGEPGGGTYLHPDQGSGRWDNPDLYLTLYLASTGAGAIGEAFAHLSRWTSAMLEFPAFPGSVRALGVYRIDEETTPLLNLDDPKALLARSLRPSEVVARNRPHTQGIAHSIFEAKAWAGISWWSMHRPQWMLHALFGAESVDLIDVVELKGHPELADAGRLLGKEVSSELL